MIVLIYMLTLAVGGDLLYTFPYLGGTGEMTRDLAGFLTSYIEWIFLDVGLVWAFAFVCLSLQDDDPRLSLHWQRWIVDHLVPLSVSTRPKVRDLVAKVALNGSIFVVLGVSVTWGMLQNWIYSSNFYGY